MNCGRTRRLLPLFAGGDLPERKARRVRKHLETCAECRREIEEYQRAVRIVADAARVTPVGDWTPGEWRAVMNRIADEKPAPRGKSASTEGAPKWVPAFASAATLIVVVAVSLLLKDSVTQPPASKQDVLTMTLVSPDTGLQVVWVFNRNFDWKGESN